MAVTSTAKSRKKMGRARKEPDQSTYSGRMAVRFRELLDRKGWAVEDLQTRLKQVSADGSEIPLTTLYNYLSGTRQIPIDLVPDLAEVFGISIRTFFPEK